MNNPYASETTQSLKRLRTQRIEFLQ